MWWPFIRGSWNNSPVKAFCFFYLIKNGSLNKANFGFTQQIGAVLDPLVYGYF